MVRVLMVCAGNICRSPMAEAVFQHMVNQAGLQDKIVVDSAGTGGWHVGECAHSGTLKELAKNNVPYDGRARQFSRTDFNNFDYIMAMDRENLANIRSKQPQDTQAVVSLFLDYADGVDETEVPDPYYQGGFDHVFALVENASRGLLAEIRQEHDL